VVYDTNGGEIRYSGKAVRDSRGIWKISLARGSELSSNTVMVQAVYENYKNNPSKFVNHVNSYGLNKKLNMDFEGEGRLLFRNQAKNWSNISLPMAFGMESR
jgi:cell division protein FtsI (penicillin-binding protein 3)